MDDGGVDLETRIKPGDLRGILSENTELDIEDLRARGFSSDFNGDGKPPTYSFSDLHLAKWDTGRHWQIGGCENMWAMLEPATVGSVRTILALCGMELPDATMKSGVTP